MELMPWSSAGWETSAMATLTAAHATADANPDEHKKIRRGTKSFDSATREGDQRIS